MVLLWKRNRQFISEMARIQNSLDKKSSQESQVYQTDIIDLEAPFKTIPSSLYSFAYLCCIDSDGPGTLNQSYGFVKK